MPNKIVSLTLSAASILMQASLSTLAATEAVTSPETQGAYERGMVAVKQKLWDVAIRNFTEAQKADAFSPEVLYNLGIASVKAGREIPASLWLRSYLEMTPETANAEKVSAEINRLEVLAEAKTQEIIDAAYKSITALPKDLEAQKKNLIGRLAFAQASTGQVDKAVALGRESALTGYDDPSKYWRYLAQYKIRILDREGALDALAKINDPAEKDILFSYWTDAYINVGALEEALEAVSKISDSSLRDDYYQRIAWGLSRALEAPQAEVLLEKILDAAKKSEVTQAVVLGYLKMDLLEEAAAWAEKLSGAAPIKKVFTGTAAVDLERIAASDPTPSERVTYERNAYLTATAAAWKGDLALAEKGCTVAKKMISKHESPQYAPAACAVWTAETRGFQESLQAAGTLEEGLQDLISETLFWRYIQKQNFAEAEAAARGASSDYVRARNLLKLANLFEEKRGDLENFMRVLVQGEEAAVKAGSAYFLRFIAESARKKGFQSKAEGISQASRAMVWIGPAKYMSASEMLTNLKNYLQKIKQAPLEERANKMIELAEAWGGALTHIRALENREKGAKV